MQAFILCLCLTARAVLLFFGLLIVLVALLSSSLRPCCIIQCKSFDRRVAHDDLDPFSFFCYVYAVIASLLLVQRLYSIRGLVDDLTNIEICSALFFYLILLLLLFCEDTESPGLDSPTLQSHSPCCFIPFRFFISVKGARVEKMREMNQ